MMRRSSIILTIAVILSGCIQKKIRETTQLDNAMLDMQRVAMWHREYSFLVIKWRGKNADSVAYYEHKMDSALHEYQYYNRRYNDLVLEHKKQK